MFDFLDNNTIIIICAFIIALIALGLGADDKIASSVVTGLIGYMGGVGTKTVVSAVQKAGDE